MSAGAVPSRLRYAALLAASLWSCEQRPARPASPPDASVAPAIAERPPVGHTRAGLLSFQGACDASGAVPLSGGRFMVADDEDNVLRVYDARRGGAPLAALDLSSELELERAENAESDIEAATLLGSEAFFLSSHGRTRKGKRDADRSLLFAITLPEGGLPPSLVGKPYRRLLDDFSREPKLASFRLAEAAERAPKAPGGLNLEGLTAAADGSLWIGLRSPIPEGLALIVPLLNPRELLHGAAARFGNPLRLDLGGLGIRALTSWHSTTWIAAGPAGEDGPFRLYRLGASAIPSLVPGVDFSDLSPEGFVSAEHEPDVLVLSDDGNRTLDGVRCKKLRDAAKKSFRGRWLTLPR